MTKRLREKIEDEIYNNKKTKCSSDISKKEPFEKISWPLNFKDNLFFKNVKNVFTINDLYLIFIMKDNTYGIYNNVTTLIKFNQTKLTYLKILNICKMGHVAFLIDEKNLLVYDALTDGFKFSINFEYKIEIIKYLSSQYFIISSDNRLFLWDNNRHIISKEFKGHNDTVTKITRLDENCFVTGSDDETIIFWNINNDTPFITSEHFDTITDIFVFKDFVLTSANDKYYCVWEKIDNKYVLRVNNFCKYSIKNFCKLNERYIILNFVNGDKIGLMDSKSNFKIVDYKVICSYSINKIININNDILAIIGKNGNFTTCKPYIEVVKKYNEKINITMVNEKDVFTKLPLDTFIVKLNKIDDNNFYLLYNIKVKIIDIVNMNNGVEKLKSKSNFIGICDNLIFFYEKNCIAISIVESLDFKVIFSLPAISYPLRISKISKTKYCILYFECFQIIEVNFDNEKTSIITDKSLIYHSFKNDDIYNIFLYNNDFYIITDHLTIFSKNNGYWRISNNIDLNLRLIKQCLILNNNTLVFNRYNIEKEQSEIIYYDCECLQITRVIPIINDYVDNIYAVKNDNIIILKSSRKIDYLNNDNTITNLYKFVDTEEDVNVIDEKIILNYSDYFKIINIE